jgi:GTP cyclohydrolase IA
VDVRLEKISEAVKVLLESIGEDVDREGLLKTPERYAKALLFLTNGYTEDLEGKKKENDFAF